MARLGRAQRIKPRRVAPDWDFDTFSETFEGGTEGTDISTGNTGFTTVSNSDSAHGSIKFQAASANRGYFGMRVTADATGSQIIAAKTFRNGPVFMRSYLRFNAATSTARIVRARVSSGATNLAMLRRLTDGTIELVSGTTNTGVKTTNSALNSWVRLEWWLDSSTSTQTLRVFTGDNLHGTTPDETISTTMAAGEPGIIQWGTPNAVEVSTDDSWDSIAFSNETWVGPSTPDRYGYFPSRTFIWAGTSGHQYTTTGNSATVTDDTSQVAPGLPLGADRSIKMVTTGVNDNDFIRKLNGTTMDFTDRVPQIWMRIQDVTRVADLNLWLGSGGGLGSAYVWSFDDLDSMKYYVNNEWFVITLPWDKATVNGTPNRAALTDFNLQFFDGGATNTIWWGGLASIPDTTTKWPNGVVSFTFDDGSDEHVDFAAPYLQGKGWAGTAFIINDVINVGNSNYMTDAEVTSLQNTYGWEVALHSGTSAQHNATNGLTSIPSEERIRSISQSNRSKLLQLGITEPPGGFSMAYPQGWYDKSLIDDLSPYVAVARSTKGNMQDSAPPGDRMKVRCFALDASTTLAAAKAQVDTAKANQNWLVFLFHEIVPSSATGNQILESTFTDLVDYVQTQSVSVLPFGTVYRQSSRIPIVFNASATLPSTSNLVTTSVVTAVAAASLSSTSNLVTTAVLDVKAAASMSSTSNLVTAGAVTVVTAPTLAATSNLVTSASVQNNASATLSSTSNLVSTPSVTVVVTKTFAGASNLVTTPAPVEVIATCNISATNNLVSTPSVTVVVTKTFAGASNLVTTASNTVNATATLAATSNLVTTAVLDVKAVATLAATSNLVTEAAGTIDGSATLPATSDFTASGAVTVVTAPTLAATSNLVTTPSVTVVASATLAATSNLVTGAVLDVKAVASLSSTSNLVTAETITVIASATLPVTSNLVTTATLTRLATATLAAVSDLVAEVQGEIGGSATLASTSSLTVVAEPLDIQAVADLPSVSNLVTGGEVIKNADLFISALSDFTISAEPVEVFAAADLAATSNLVTEAQVGNEQAASATLAATSNLVTGAVRTAHAAVSMQNGPGHLSAVPSPITKEASADIPAVSNLVTVANIGLFATAAIQANSNFSAHAFEEQESFAHLVSDSHLFIGAPTLAEVFIRQYSWLHATAEQARGNTHNRPSLSARRWRAGLAVSHGRSRWTASLD